MSYAELVGLTQDDFNFKNNTIDINKTWGYNKDMHQEFGPTKNTSSIRIIKMDNQTMSIFKSFLTLSTNSFGLVFYSPHSKYKIISNRNAKNCLKNY